jgi:acyl-CoA-binding protein
MSDLQSQFEQAATAAKQLRARPSNEAMLMLYALYKQATSGDVSGSRPGFTDMVGRAKYDAWARVKGTSREAAMRDYVAYVQKLQN